MNQDADIPIIGNEPLPEHFHRRCFWFTRHFGYAVDRVVSARNKMVWEHYGQEFKKLDASGWDLKKKHGALYPVEFNQPVNLFDANDEDDKETMIALEKKFEFMKADIDKLAEFLGSWDWDGIYRFGFQKFEFLDFLHEFGFHGLMNYEHGSDKFKGFLSIGLFQEHMDKIDLKKPLIVECDGNAITVTENY